MHKHERASYLARIVQRIAERGGKVGKVLASDIVRCGEDWSGRYRCRSVVCPRCRAGTSRGEAHRAVAWADATGEGPGGWAKLTVVAGVTADAGEARPIARAAMQRVRNALARERERDPGPWDLVEVRGWIETDAVGGHHVPALGDKRRAAIEALGGRLDPDAVGATWVPTIHAAVRLPTCPGGDGRERLARLKEALAAGRRGDLGLHADSLVPRDGQSMGEAVGEWAAYASKSGMATAVPVVAELRGRRSREARRDPWPVAWAADYAVAARQGARGLKEYLRLTIAPARSIECEDDHDDRDDDAAIVRRILSSAPTTVPDIDDLTDHPHRRRHHVLIVL